MASGLVKIRRCAWLAETADGPARPVFVRGKTLAFRCPKSIVTAQSLEFIELFAYWKQCGGDLWPLDAKTADALLALAEASAKENKNEE